MVAYIFGTLGIQAALNLMPNLFFKLVAIVTIMASRGDSGAEGGGADGASAATNAIGLSAGAAAAATYSMVLTLGAKIQELVQRTNDMHTKIRDWDLLCEFLEVQSPAPVLE